MNLPLKVPDDFRIIAHRGASGYAPENTLAAFRLAAEMGVSEVETDVRTSKDGQLVLCHDADLRRYGYPGLLVEALTLDELLTLDMGSWYSPFLYGGEQLLTLEALLEQFGERFIYHLELKDPTTVVVREILKALKFRGYMARAILISFDFKALVEIREREPGLPVGWLVKRNGLSAENITRAADAGFYQLCPLVQETNPDNVSAAHRLIPEVRAHGVFGLPELLNAVNAGCDGLTIDWPDWLVHEQVAVEIDPPG